MEGTRRARAQSFRLYRSWLRIRYGSDELCETNGGVVYGRAVEREDSLPDHSDRMYSRASFVTNGG